MNTARAQKLEDQDKVHEEDEDELLKSLEEDDNIDLGSIRERRMEELKEQYVGHMANPVLIYTMAQAKQTTS